MGEASNTSGTGTGARDWMPELGASVYIPQKEGDLHVITRGTQGPPVLLLSGAGNDNAVLSWRRAIPALAAEHRVFALDWPKQGGSKPWRGMAAHDRMLQAVTTVLDYFDIDRADLVGISQGGALGLGYTLESPERVRRLVLIAPGGIISFPPVVHQMLWLMAKLPLLARTIPSLLFRSRAACAWFARTALFAGPVDDFDEIVDEYHRDVLVNGSGSSDWQNNSIGFRRMNIDFRPQLHTIAHPTLLIQGTKDIGIKPEHTRAAAQAIPESRLEMVEGAGHWVNRQEPERVNQLILDFLQ